MAWFEVKKGGSSPTPPAPAYESYIYNVGNCAFNTGYNHKSTTRIKFKASIDAISGGWRQLWGHDQNGWRNNAFESATGDSTQLALVLKNGWTQGDVWTATESSTSALWSNVPCIFETNGTTLSWYRESDPNTVRSISPSGTIADAIAPMAIFRNNSASTADGWTIGGHSAFMRLFWFEIYEDSTLLHRYVPAYNNGQWCLYDEIDQVYKYDVENNGANLRGWLAS